MRFLRKHFDHDANSRERDARIIETKPKGWI